MIDYDKIEKAKELWSRYEEFDKQWLGTRGVFNIMHKAGMLDDEDHKEILEHYDRMLAPVSKFKAKVKAQVIERVSRVAWKAVIEDKGKK